MTSQLQIDISAEEDSSAKQKTGYRELPCNLEAEQGLLGALMIDNRALEHIGDFLKAEHFFAPAHQRIYKAIVTLADRGQSASPVTLKGYFANDEDLACVGGSEYLADLAASVVSVINSRDYAQTIYDLYLRRELIGLGQEVVNEAFDQNIEENASSIIERSESNLYNLAETGEMRGGFVELKDSVLAAIDQAERAFKSDNSVTGVSTGLKDMDQKLGGLHNSDLLILAARPSMGKTALGVNIGFNAAELYDRTNGRQGAITGFFSLEMSSDQLATRVLADQSGISGDSLRKGNIQEKDFRRFVEASQKLSKIPLYIDDTPALTIGAIRTRARRLKRQYGLGLLIVDYLQLLSGSGSRQSESNRVLEISEITRGLKAIAKDLQIPVLALSQLSRAVEQREDKRPQLSDLRESGSIEQDADVVMFIYREEYYLSRTQPDIDDSEKFTKWQEKMDKAHNIAEVLVAKQRHGPIGNVKLFYDANLTRFSDLDRSH
jgi:replicative DNA helicase